MDYHRVGEEIIHLGDHLVESSSKHSDRLFEGRGELAPGRGYS